MQVDQAQQQRNRDIFQQLVNDQCEAARALGKQLWDEFGTQELQGLVGTPMADITDAQLARIHAHYGYHDENSFEAKRQKFTSNCSTERFLLICELSGMGGDRDALLAREDKWDVAAEHGLERALSTAAADAVYDATSGDEATEDFLFDCAREVSLRQQREAAKWLEVDGVKYAVVETTPVLFSGWECDGTAWVIDKAGQRVLVTTNHGSKVEGNVEFLQSKLAEYREAIESTLRALAAVGVTEEVPGSATLKTEATGG